MALQHLAGTASDIYEDTTKSLKERFELPSRRDHHQAEFLTYRKKKEEPWANNADALKVLVGKANPHYKNGL